ncbi:MAG: tryptophan 2,3-dioxygenase [Alphaproteobacteria bacterium]|nr:tryptophan 2,3-dioxygenase [Alphaproteobacteria bacterium]
MTGAREAGPPAAPDAQAIVASEVTYSGGLRLDLILNAQFPHLGAHDEMLFIVIHQASELWMKLMLHELAAADRHLAAGTVRPALKMLARIKRVQEQLTQSWNVLSTMTPVDFLAFRHALGASSGFESFQYREIEFRLGYKRGDFLDIYRRDPATHGRLKAALEAPSIYDRVLMLLAKAGHALPAEVVKRDWSKPYVPHPAVEEAWKAVYRRPEASWELYELAESLLDISDRFQHWRHAHATAVERVIGMKPGTGGSAGVPYLRRALDHRFFPELWSMRTAL